MDDNLCAQFGDELESLIDKYSYMEMTKAEAVGVLEFAKNRIITADDGEEI